MKTSGESPAGVTPPSAPGGREGFLSDVIVELGFATRRTVEQAVRAARSPGTTVAGVLVDMEAISERQLAQAIAERHGIDYIDLEGFAVDPAAANLIKPTAARRYQAVPVGFLGQGLLVAMADPADRLGVNDIAVMTKLDVRPAVAARPALGALLEALPLDEGAYDHGAALAANAEGANKQPPKDEAETAIEPASSAVFWQDGSGDELPEGLDGSPAEAGGDASQLRDDLTALKRQLAGAEARLGGKAAGSASGPDADVTELRARLAEAETELRRIRADVDVRSGEIDALREKLTDAETELVRERAERAELEQRLAEVDGSAVAAERAFEELRVAQGRMRGALEALADPGAPKTTNGSDPLTIRQRPDFDSQEVPNPGR